MLTMVFKLEQRFFYLPWKNNGSRINHLWLL